MPTMLDRLCNWSQAHPWTTAMVVCLGAMIFTGWMETPR